MLVPILWATVFTTGTVAVAATSVARAHGATRGWLTAAAIVASPVFLTYAPSQVADIPLSFFVLTTFVVIREAMLAVRATAGWLLAGASAALAAWTKNEGTAFLIVVLTACSVWALRSHGRAGLRQVVLLVAGAGPAVLALASFRFWVAPASEMVEAAQSLDVVLPRLVDPDRLQTIAGGIVRELWFGGARFIGVLPIIGLSLALTDVRRPPVAAALAFTCAASMLVVFAAAYAVSPYDLRWHMSTSVDRLVLQLFPTLVWAAMMIRR